MSSPTPSPELVQFVQSGISVLVGSRDARLMPDCSRAVGARVEDDGGTMTVYLPPVTSQVTLANLRDNGRIAVAFSRPADHRSVQVKGRVLEIREADAADREWIDRYRGELVQNWGFVGVPPRFTLRAVSWPSQAVRFRIESWFVQTPGPDAGAALQPGTETGA